MRFWLIALFLLILNGFIGFGMPDLSGLENIFNQLEDDERECLKECMIQQGEDKKQCNQEHEEARQLCSDQKNEALDACRNLPSNERKTCIASANQQDKNCKDQAKLEKDVCKMEAEQDRLVCKIGCKQLGCEAPEHDTDNDGIPDHEDNCPFQPNPGQEDLNHNNIGDACDQFTCCMDDLLGECFSTTIDQCRNLGGAVMECLPHELPSSEEPVSQLTNATPVRFNASDEALQNLTRDINTTNVARANNYSAAYDCDDFATSLETNLTALGYNATITLYWCYGGIGNPPAAAHAVNDVHLADGRLVFVEPQTGRIINLDFDNDGQVEYNDGAYTPGANMGQTDDNCKISKFESRAHAEASGAPID